MHRMGNFIVGQFPPQLLFHFLNHLVPLLRALGKSLQYLITHAFDFKTVFCRSDLIADFLNPFRQFIPINRCDVSNRVIHRTGLKRLPASFLFVKRGIEHRAMRVQQRVEFAGTVMQERGGDQVARYTVTLIATFANPRRGKGFKFTERNAHRFPVRRHQSFIIQCHRQHRNRFWRGTGKIIKHPSLVLLLLPLRQAFAGFRI